MKKTRLILVWSVISTTVVAVLLVVSCLVIAWLCIVSYAYSEEKRDVYSVTTSRLTHSSCKRCQEISSPIVEAYEYEREIFNTFHDSLIIHSKECVECKKIIANFDWTDETRDNLLSVVSCLDSSSCEKCREIFDSSVLQAHQLFLSVNYDEERERIIREAHAALISHSKECDECRKACESYGIPSFWARLLW